jgi:IclR family transcriptional regulator, acetate operon repressor
MTDPIDAQAPVRSVKKAMELLSILIFEDVNRHGWAVGELAKRAGLPLTTTHNLLRSLCVAGYAQQPERGVYAAGSLITEIGGLNRWTTPERRQSIAELLAKAVASIGEISTFSILREGRRVLIASADHRQAVRIDHDYLERQPFFQLTSGRALCAWCSESERNRILHVQGMPRADWDGIASATRLQRACSQIRQVGIVERRLHQAVSLALPVLDSHDHLIGILGLHAPEFRFKAKQRETALAVLQQCRADIRALEEDSHVE